MGKLTVVKAAPEELKKEVVRYKDLKFGELFRFVARPGSTTSTSGWLSDRLRMKLDGNHHADLSSKYGPQRRTATTSLNSKVVRCSGTLTYTEDE